MGQMRGGGARVDGPPWLTWVSWAKEPVPELFDSDILAALQCGKVACFG